MNLPRKPIGIAVLALVVLLSLPSGCSLPGSTTAERSSQEDGKNKQIFRIPCQPDTWVVPGKLKLTTISQVANGTTVTFTNLHRAQLTLRVRPVYLHSSGVEIRKGPPTWSKLSIPAGSSVGLVFTSPAPYADLKELMVDLDSSED